MMLFVCFPLIWAQAENLNDILTKMEQVNLQMQDMQFDYVQKLKYRDIEEEQTTQEQ